MSVNNLACDAMATRAQVIIAEPPSSPIEDRVSAAASAALLTSSALLRARVVSILGQFDEDVRAKIPAVSNKPRAILKKRTFEGMPPALPPAASAPAPFGDAQSQKRSKPSHEESVLPKEPSPVQNASSLRAIPANVTRKHWSREELRALNRHSTFEDALKDPDLKDRLEDAIRTKWLELHPEDKKHRLWSNKELEALKACKTFLDALEAPLLQGRSEKAIRTQWLKLYPEDRCYPTSEWKDRELKALKKCTYPEALKDSDLQGRSAAAIRQKMYDLNKVKDKAPAAASAAPSQNKKWNSEELDTAFALAHLCNDAT